MNPAENTKPRLGDILTRLKLVTDEQVQAALEHQSTSGKLFGESLLSLGFVGEDDLSWALSSQLGLPFVMVTPEMVDQELLQTFPADFLRRNLIIPLVASEKNLSVVLADPTDEVALTRLQYICGYQLNIAIATPTAIRRCLTSVLGPESRKSEEDADAESVAPPSLSTPELAQLLDRAFTHGATHIHLDPEGEKVRVRFRVTGNALIEGGTFNPDALAALVGGLQGWLGGAESPADGISQWNAGPADDGELPFHATAVDTDEGPSLTLALRGTESGRRSLSAGFEEEWSRLENLLQRGSGLVLAAAPSAWERQTLLERLLGEINAAERRCLTFVSDGAVLPAGTIRFPGAPDSCAVRALALGEGFDIMAGAFPDLSAAADLAAAAESCLVVAVFPGQSALGALARVLERGVSATALSEVLLASAAQRVVPPGQQDEGPRAVSEILFIDEPLRRALQDGGATPSLRSAAAEQGLVEIAARARSLKNVDYKVIEDLKRHQFLEDAA